MRILYITRHNFTDSDFPLIKELQRKGLDIDVYSIGTKYSTGILEFPRNACKYGLNEASKIESLRRLYGNYIDLSKIKLITIINGRKGELLRFFVFIRLYFKLRKEKYDLIHITWQLNGFSERILYRLNAKKVLTVHDPITHSGQEWMEKDRLYAFKCCNHFILLSDVLKESFSEKYKIDYNHISLTRMGEFDYLNNIPMTRPVDNSKYILFFGSITRHKGLDYLLKAMILVHEKCPDLKLVIAGRGKLYFDFSPYKKQDFIVTIFRYVGIQEMVELFRNCEFAVCPYNDATQSGVVQTAFSMNTPIVATNVGALPLSIKDGVTGIIVPPRDVESLAEAIIDLSQNRIKISSFKKNIEKYWRPTMSWNTIADEYINIYKSLL